MSGNGLTKRNEPAQCSAREDVRHEIDRIDDALITLLGERWQYVHRMSQIKTSVDQANVPSRVNQVISNVVQRSENAEFPAELAEDMWRKMIDFAIKYEEQQISARNSK